MMARIAEKSLTLAALVIIGCLHGMAQTDLKVSSDLRVSFQAKETREGGDPTQAEIGPSLDFYLKPLIRLQDVTKFDLDDSKSRPLVFTVGYRYLPQANNAPATNRMELVVTFHFPLKRRFLLTDRNRADLDWKTGNFSWRYRNRFQIEKRVTIRSYHPGPYASVEFFYESQHSKWSDTAIYTGCLFPIGNTRSSIRITSTRTTPAKAPISN